MGNYFTEDNTQGYSKEEIVELNQIAEKTITDGMDEEDVQYEMEKILDEFQFN